MKKLFFLLLLVGCADHQSPEEMKAAMAECEAHGLDYVVVWNIAHNNYRVIGCKPKSNDRP